MILETGTIKISMSNIVVSISLMIISKLDIITRLSEDIITRLSKDVITRLSKDIITRLYTDIYYLDYGILSIVAV